MSNLISKKPWGLPRPPPPGVCGSVCEWGGGWSGVKGWGVGWGVGWEACYRGCYGHSKPGFDIKFEITFFEI